MSNFIVQDSNIESITWVAVSNLLEVTDIATKMKEEFHSLPEETSKQILQQSVQQSSNLSIATDSDWVLKEFNTESVYWFVVAAKWTTKPIGTVRYFKNAGNAVFTPNWSNQIFKLWRITSSWLKQIKKAS